MRKKFAFIGMLLILGFVVLSKYEDRPVMRTVDFASTVKVQNLIDRSSHLRSAEFIGNVMEGATFFASPEFTVFVTLTLTALLGIDFKKRRLRPRALLIPIALFGIVILEIVGKSIVHHPSPPFTMIKHPTTIFPADYVNEQFSYPSGHAARAIFMAIVSLVTLAIYRIGKGYARLLIGAILLGYVVLVSVSRIYLGHHWFSDVLGGLLLGSGVTCWAVIPLLPSSNDRVV